MIAIRRCFFNLPMRGKMISFNVRTLSMMTDITGSMYRSPASSISDDLDQCIVDIISHNNFAGPDLKKIRSKHRCAFVDILLMYEAIRYSDSSALDKLWSEFNRFELLLVDDKLNKREALFVAGALQWFLGNYNKAGALLETVLIDNPGDVLALALSQDAYMTGGSTADILGCAIRHNSPFHTKAHLHGYLQGILAAGYVETGRLAMAEEVGLQAISVTRGNSSWAIHSLINSYQLSGKSSDMLSKLNEFQSLHEDNSGTILLLYNKGCAHIMRGSYIAAFNSLENIASHLSDESSSELPAAATAATWRSVVLLLWKLELAMADLNIPSMFDPMWVSLAGSSYCTSVPFGNIALQDACVALVLTFAAHADVNKVTKTNRVAVAPSTKPVKSWWSRVVGKDEGSRGDNSGDSDFNTYQDLQSTILSIYGFDDAQTATSTLKGIKDKLLMHTTMNENALHGALDQISPDRGNVTKELFAVGTRRPDGFCAKLMSIQPLVPQLNNRKYLCETSAKSSLTDVEWSIIHSSGPLLKALSFYHSGDYGASSALLANITSHSHLLGGTVVQRETMRSMLIDTLLRDEQVSLVKMLLTERSVLVPADAQCWSQLSRVYRLLGQHDRAEQAHYTSWQLGIGQGGFGGFK